MIVMFWVCASPSRCLTSASCDGGNQAEHAGIDFNPGVFQWVVEFGAPVELLRLMQDLPEVKLA